MSSLWFDHHDANRPLEPCLGCGKEINQHQKLDEEE
ncbi:hypothetical protein ACOMICROBIO_LMKGKHOH_04312 [Vibrio sp. B1FIG11]|nr:hypothetical protein ACOMICROBIO_LMKGKHOH_04312 [Vibrio sp. B1FIG11]CAE6936613.1 hypothetical protein ACOMICROBIO_LMKGKHOH_04312 [Vibrio sp. B1FIG11]